ncbi:MAG TPA: DUF2231 domain-containing protein [Arachnia sp.]|nr:DUF2231 domain-containing protein [Arachnia sp.]
MDLFDLPLHPLVVHAAVVLVPIAALGALALVAIPKLRARYGWLTVAVAIAAAVSALTARFTGDVLMESLGLGGVPQVQAHRMWGVWAPWPVLILALVLPVLVRFDGSQRVVLIRVAAAVTVVAALASLVLIGLTGHAGATAVWGE